MLIFLFTTVPFLHNKYLLEIYNFLKLISHFIQTVFMVQNGLYVDDNCQSIINGGWTFDEQTSVLWVTVEHATEAAERLGQAGQGLCCQMLPNMDNDTIKLKCITS